MGHLLVLFVFLQIHQVHEGAGDEDAEPDELSV